jgi:hypothetical protein
MLMLESRFPMPHTIVFSFVLFALMQAPALSQQTKRLAIESSHISSRDLPLQFDEERTFVYANESVDPESLLTAMKNAGIDIVRAWQPQNNLCMGIIGPRFTVELASDDARILAYGFMRGTGRLQCSTELILFTLSD